jgi:drug/metabolite transporter (DMT)-like permease
MAWLVIDEPITVNMIVGIALILFGSCLSIISKRKKAA